MSSVHFLELRRCCPTYMSLHYDPQRCWRFISPSPFGLRSPRAVALHSVLTGIGPLPKIGHSRVLRFFALIFIICSRANELIFRVLFSRSEYHILHQRDRVPISFPLGGIIHLFYNFPPYFTTTTSSSSSNQQMVPITGRRASEKKRET